jgi:hypothetical protein
MVFLSSVLAYAERRGTYAANWAHSFSLAYILRLVYVVASTNQRIALNNTE